MSKMLVRNPFGLSLGLGLALILAGPLDAGDGIFEINQACAVNTGCFPGDTAGFPVTINAGGSYGLTGDLTVSDGDTSGIQIFVNGVSVDLNGFTLICPGCSPGSGYGIAALTPVTDVAVVNGFIEGFGDNGVYLQNIGARVERIRAILNHGHGIRVGWGAAVTDCTANQNDDMGILAGFSTVLRDNTVTGNGSHGISTGVGVVIEGCVSAQNGGDGIRVIGYSVIRGNLSRQNTGAGFNNVGPGSPSGIAHNVFSVNTGGDIIGSFNQTGTNQCGENTTCP